MYISVRHYIKKKITKQILKLSVNIMKQKRLYINSVYFNWDPLKFGTVKGVYKFKHFFLKIALK